MKIFWTKWIPRLLMLFSLLNLPLAKTNIYFPFIQSSGGDDLNAPLDPKQIRQTLRLVADFQMSHPEDADVYPTGNWTMAPLYDGLVDTSLVLNDPRYLAPVIRAGRKVIYAPGRNLGDADSHGSGSTWLRIYMMDPDRDPKILERFEKRFKKILKDRVVGTGWSWVDALYMAPPTLVRMGQATGDVRYYNLALSEFLVTHVYLYDLEEHLYYRDSRFFDGRTENDKKIFWSRGNGWAYAGLTEMLENVPRSDPSRDFYLYAFREMSPVLLQAQQADGFWYPNLADPEDIDMGEVSGSALFLYGFAWGVDQGILDRDVYMPAIVRGWNAILTQINSHGEVDSVQPVASQPNEFDKNNSEPFGTGAVLAAGSQILRLLNAEAAVNPAQLREAAEKLADKAPDLSK